MVSSSLCLHMHLNHPLQQGKALAYSNISANTSLVDIGVHCLIVKL